MNERLLQFIWQFQYFNNNNLITTEGDAVQIIYAGTFNTNQGPDFLDAKIRIGKTTWAGNVELHVYSADWETHAHSNDSNYSNVILHVVWKNNSVIYNNIPVLVLQERISSILLDHYRELMSSQSFIACEKNIATINPITWLSWKERLLVERLEQRSSTIFDHLKTTTNHWEEVFWWMLARNFGITINSDAFEAIARSIPITVLAKHKNQLQQVEALLFGQSGLLNVDFVEDYPKLLQREYRFLKKKYQLQSIHKPIFFLRMRPANFPTIRLAQLAVLIQQSVHLFATIKELDDVKEVRALLDITANDYWHYHYIFDEETGFQKKKLGKQMIDNLFINTIVPIVFAYGLYHNDEKLKSKALHWLTSIAAEKNNITKGFSVLGIEQENAFDTQALIQLKNMYCAKKKCLDCAVGNKLLRS